MEEKGVWRLTLEFSEEETWKGEFSWDGPLGEGKTRLRKEH